MRWGTLVLVIASLAVMASCKKPKVGDPCDGRSGCLTGTTALACIGGSYVEAPCTGPAGCKASPFVCDFTENANGTACVELRQPAPQTCTADNKARIQCKAGKIIRDECDGPGGCSEQRGTEDSRKCARAVRAGAACSGDGDWCSENASEWLQCANGKLQVAAFCRGPSGCRPMLDAIACDTSVGVIGDPCVGNTKSCAPDRRALLRCAAGHLENEETCPIAKACDNGALACR